MMAWCKIGNKPLSEPMLTWLTEADQKNSLVSGPPTDPATTPPTVNFLQQSEQKGFFYVEKI